jgi:hypothetical protein
MIFDSTKQGISFLPKELVIWPMGVLFNSVDGVKDFSQNHPERIRQYLSYIPPHSNVCLDLEGDYQATDGRQLWHLIASQQSAIDLRVEALEIAKAARPDCKFGVYSVPYRVLDDIVEHERAYTAITDVADLVYITAYPKPGQSFDEWQRELRMKVGAAYLIHEKVPRVLITHETPRVTLDYKQFQRRVRFVKRMGLDQVYWVSAKTPPPWWVKLILWTEVFA